MRFLEIDQYILFCFLLVPLVIHLFKRMQAQRVIMSSLYLLRRKKANLSQKLKFSQLMLLVSRFLVVISLVLFFMKPVLTSSPEWLRKFLPYEDRLRILLDNRWDDRETMISKWYQARGQQVGIELDFITLYDDDIQTDFFRKIIQNIDTNFSQTILFSRFYGSPHDELKAIQNLGIQMVFYGPQKVDNRALLNVSLEPATALLGENVSLSGSVHTNSSTSTSTQLNLFLDGQRVSHQILEPTADIQANFNFSILVDTDRSKKIKLEIPPDILTKDDQVELTLEVKSSLNILLVDDQTISTQRNSRLFYVRQFLESLKQIFPKVTIQIRDTNSKIWMQSNEKIDWLIVGNINNFIWKRGAENMLIFAQPERSVQSRIDQQLGMKSYAIEALPRKVEFTSLSPEEAVLYEVPWQTYRYLQLRQEEGTHLAVSGTEVLIFKKDNVCFSAFDFGKYDFSGISHPYFPVFLYQLFLNRFPIKAIKQNLSVTTFERDSNFAFQSESGIANAAGWSDLSKLLLGILLLWLLVEIYLIKNIQSLSRESYL